LILRRAEEPLERRRQQVTTAGIAVAAVVAAAHELTCRGGELNAAARSSIQ
jgi:hypothetical protein